MRFLCFFFPSRVTHHVGYVKNVSHKLNVYHCPIFTSWWDLGIYRCSEWRIMFSWATCIEVPTTIYLLRHVNNVFGSHSSKWLGNVFKQNIQSSESLEQIFKLKFVIFKHVTKIPTSWTTNLVQLIAKSNKFNTTIFYLDSPIIFKCIQTYENYFLNKVFLTQGRLNESKSCLTQKHTPYKGWNIHVWVRIITHLKSWYLCGLHPMGNSSHPLKDLILWRSLSKCM
jgi:hypothetical protein